MQDVGEVVVQIGAFILAAALLGLWAGVLCGRRSGVKRAQRRRKLAAEAEPEIVRATRVLVRPDPALFAENERLRDRLIIVHERARDLEARLAARDPAPDEVVPADPAAADSALVDPALVDGAPTVAAVDEGLDPAEADVSAEVSDEDSDGRPTAPGLAPNA